MSDKRKNQKMDRTVLRAHSDAIKDVAGSPKASLSVTWPHCIYCGQPARRGEQWCPEHADVAHIEHLC